jgi:hypothetical protein
MEMMKSIAEKKLRKIGMKRIKKRVIRQCLGDGEREKTYDQGIASHKEFSSSTFHCLLVYPVTNSFRR